VKLLLIYNVYYRVQPLGTTWLRRGLQNLRCMPSMLVLS